MTGMAAHILLDKVDQQPQDGIKNKWLWVATHKLER